MAEKFEILKLQVRELLSDKNDLSFDKTRYIGLFEFQIMPTRGCYARIDDRTVTLEYEILHILHHTVSEVTRKVAHETGFPESLKPEVVVYVGNGILVDF